MSQPVVTTGPGEVLRARREALGMSLEQAAAQLNLKAAVIHQLESQQWDPRVAPTFIRGYLRHYARLLKLDEAEVLGQFDQLLAALPPPTPMHSFSNKTSRDAAESRFMLATYFLLVLLIGLFLVWFWQTHMLNEQPVTMMPELDTPATAVEPAVTKTAPVLTVVAEPAVPETAPAEHIASGQTNSSETNTSIPPGQTPPEAAPVTAVLNAIPGTVAPAVTSGQQQTTAITSEPVPPAAADAALPTVASGTELQLQLQFSAQCWVTVIDATGKRLAYSMQNSGQSLTLTGVAPLKVTFGDPAAVAASLGGKTIDLSGYKQGQVARLTLTGSE